MRLWITGNLVLASTQHGEYASIKELSKRLDISFHFLTKILQQITAVDLLESLKRPNGGVRLSKAAKEISLVDIVVAIDGDDLFQECVLGWPGKAVSVEQYMDQHTRRCTENAGNE